MSTVRDNEDYKSTQYQLGDSTRRLHLNTTYAGVDEHTEGVSRSISTSRKQVRKEIHQANKASLENDAGVASAAGSPFKRGMTVTQQLEIVKIQSIRTMEEQKTCEAEFATGCHNLQSEIDNRMELARMWKVTDQNDPLFVEIASLMSEKVGLINSFKAEKERLNRKRIATDEMIQNAFIPRSRWSPSTHPTSISLLMRTNQNPTMSNSLVDDDENLTSPEEDDIMSSS